VAGVLLLTVIAGAIYGLRTRQGRQPDPVAIEHSPATVEQPNPSSAPPPDPKAELAALTHAVQMAADDEVAASDPSLRARLAQFWMSHPGTPEQLAAAKLMPQLIWPADRLQPDTIPSDELAAAAGVGPEGKAPAELVAIFGDSRLKHWNFVRSIDFSPDSKLLASPGYDGAVRIWNALDGRFIAQLKPTVREYEAVRFLPDGKTLVGVGADGWLTFWDTTSWEVTHRLSRQKR
jgi:hypothetical protein